MAIRPELLAYSCWNLNLLMREVGLIKGSLAAALFIPLIVNFIGNLSDAGSPFTSNIPEAALSLFTAPEIVIPKEFARAYVATLLIAASNIVYVSFAPIPLKFETKESWSNSFNAHVETSIRCLKFTNKTPTQVKSDVNNLYDNPQRSTTLFHTIMGLVAFVLSAVGLLLLVWTASSTVKFIAKAAI